VQAGGKRSAQLLFYHGRWNMQPRFRRDPGASWLLPRTSIGLEESDLGTDTVVYRYEIDETLKGRWAVWCRRRPSCWGPSARVNLRVRYTSGRIDSRAASSALSSERRSP